MSETSLPRKQAPVWPGPGLPVSKTIDAKPAGDDKPAGTPGRRGNQGRTGP